MQRIIRVQLDLRKELGERIQPDEVRAYLDDIHRAVIVFAHSSLETTLTELIRIRLKTRPDPLAEQIPFAGGKSDRITLKELWKYRGKTIEQLLDESIDEYMNKKSFNQLEDITSMLEEMGIEVRVLKPHLGIISQMIQRRHRIVHESDFVRGSTGSQLTQIDFNEVASWASTVREFCYEVMKAVIVSKSLTEDLANKAQRQGIHTTTEEVTKAIRSMLNLPITPTE